MNTPKKVILPSQITAAVPPDSELVLAKSGSTWNDGGMAYSAVFRLPTGKLMQVSMLSDYRSDELLVEEVQEVTVVTKHYEPVKKHQGA